MTRKTREWIIPVGKDAEGKPEFRVIGHELEDDFGGGNKTTRLEICLDILNPVLYQQVKAMNEVKTSSVGIAIRRDFAKRYKSPNQAPEPEPQTDFAVLPGCQLIAHNTGDGWWLGMQEIATSETVDETGLPWPSTWPDNVTGAWLEARGFKIMP